MQLHKTDRARAELKSGTRTLGQRERTLLLLADGSKSVQDFRPLFNGDGEEIALRLMRDGFLQAQPGHAPQAARPAMPAAENPQFVKTDKQPLPPPPAAPQAAARVSADQFEGKRSLATTRMFLFDICERMFSRKNPELAGDLPRGLARRPGSRGHAGRRPPHDRGNREGHRVRTGRFHQRAHRHAAACRAGSLRRLQLHLPRQERVFPAKTAEGA